MKIRLPADQRAPSRARAFVRDRLRGAALPSHLLVEDVELIASELVTNAVRAGAAQVQLTMELDARGLDLTVEDDAEGWPTVMVVDEQATNGRGLHMVQQLADALTVTARTTGKRVTASWSDTPALDED